MISEKEYKEKFIESLNTKNPGWIDGDQELLDKPRADVVNHQLKIAIEIKDDTKFDLSFKLNGVTVSSTDLSKKNRQFKDDVKCIPEICKLSRI